MYKNNFAGRSNAALLVFILSFTIIISTATSQDNLPSISTKKTKVTPSDVFATVDLLNQSLDFFLKAKQIKPPQSPKRLEKGLGPMHVYQLVVACVNKMYEFDIQINSRPIPQVIVRPMKYTPADVITLVELMLDDVWRTAKILKIDYLPDDIVKVSGKTPTDVFQVTLDIFMKLNALTGQQNIDPSKVFSEMVRAVTDVKSILSQIDPLCRYKINAPVSKPGLRPSDVFTGCLTARHVINKYRQEFNMKIIPVPNTSYVSGIQPIDVFVQTQILIAEINLLKMTTNTISSTPLAIPVTGKLPTDVHQQAVLIQYLLNQIGPLKDIVAQD